MMGEARRADWGRRFPFSAVAGQDDAKLAVLLGTIDPAIGGVLLRGEKGSGRSTLARGLAGLLPGGAPFVEVPLGADEDQVLGWLETPAPGPAMGQGPHFRAGLVARAHGGVLYLDAVNLLPDHVVEVLLDVAVSGFNRVERHGVWHEHPAAVVLVGAMDPAEGELRPHLLDRFGLSAEVEAPTDPRTRAEVVRRRLAHDAGGLVEGQDNDIVLRARLAAAMPADLPPPVVDFACHLALGLGASGLRGDLMLCRAAAALAGWEGRSVTTDADVERVAPLALAHRRRRRPFDPPTLVTGELERALVATRQAFEVEPAGSGAESAPGGTTETPPTLQSRAEVPAGDGETPADAAAPAAAEGSSPPEPPAAPAAAASDHRPDPSGAET